PLVVPETDIKDIKVLMTMIDGEIEYIRPDDPETTTTTIIPSTTQTTTTTNPSTSVSSLTSTISITAIPVFPMILSLVVLLCSKRIKKG
ncbi:MAG: hypothetical protein ACTSSO_06320, partial [Candidatus Hodarchaeales archaeon]